MLHMMRARKTNLKCRRINSCTHYYRGARARERTRAQRSRIPKDPTITQFAVCWLLCFFPSLFHFSFVRLCISCAHTQYTFAVAAVAAAAAASTVVAVRQHYRVGPRAPCFMLFFSCFFFCISFGAVCLCHRRR